MISICYRSSGLRADRLLERSERRHRDERAVSPLPLGEGVGGRRRQARCGSAPNAADPSFGASRHPRVQAYDIHTSLGARAECAAWPDGKTSNIIKPSSTSAQAPLQEGRPRSPSPGGPAFRPRREIPAPREKFPAHSLLGAKKFPASPLREFAAKDLKSNAFSARIFPRKAEFAANSLRAGNFLLTPPPKAAPPRRARPPRSGLTPPGLASSLSTCVNAVARKGRRGAPAGAINWKPYEVTVSAPGRDRR